VQTFADSVPIRGYEGRTDSLPGKIPSRPVAGGLVLDHRGWPLGFGPLPRKKCLPDEQLFQNRRVQTASPTEPHTLDCTTHFARLTNFENPPRKTVCMGATMVSFAVGAQRQGQPRLPPRLQRGWLPPQVERKNGESSPRFPAQGVTAEIPLSIPLPPIPRDGSSGMSTGMGDPSPARRSQGNDAVS